jgi:hypothetical protein
VDARDHAEALTAPARIAILRALRNPTHPQMQTQPLLILIATPRSGAVRSRLPVEDGMRATA